MRLGQIRKEGVTLLLEGGKVGHLGEAATGTRRFKHFSMGGLGAEPVLVQVVQLDVGTVEEFDPFVGAIDDDRGREPLEHLGVRGDVTFQAAPGVFEVGDIPGDADRAGIRAERRFGEVIDAALAARDDVVDGRARLPGPARPRGKRLGLRAIGPGDRLAAARYGGLRVGLEDVGVRLVAVHQRLVGTAQPDGQRQRVEHRAQPLAVCPTYPDGGKQFTGAAQRQHPCSPP